MNDTTIAELRAELDRLRSRMTALEGELERRADPPPEPADLTRRALLRRIGTVAAAGGAVVAGGIASAGAAAAADGDPILAGRTTSADVETRLDGGMFTSWARGSTTWALYGVSVDVTSFDLQQCAVLAESYGSPGVLALSAQNYGVIAKTEAGHHAVHAQYGPDDVTFAPIDDGAVGGVATGVNGVNGVSDSATGVSGRSTTGTGVAASTVSSSSFSPALTASTPGRGSAITATASNTANNSAAANIKNLGTGSGVSASSTKGIGGSFGGGQAALRLVPRSTTGHPTTGAHVVGELVVDSAGALFVCTAAGTPGTWKRVTVT